MSTHLEPDILESEGKWALGSIAMNKASGGDGSPVELFQDDVEELMLLNCDVSGDSWESLGLQGDQTSPS